MRFWQIYQRAVWIQTECITTFVTKHSSATGDKDGTHSTKSLWRLPRPPSQDAPLPSVETWWTSTLTTCVCVAVQARDGALETEAMLLSNPDGRAPGSALVSSTRNLHFVTQGVWNPVLAAVWTECQNLAFASRRQLTTSSNQYRKKLIACKPSEVYNAQQFQFPKRWTTSPNLRSMLMRFSGVKWDELVKICERSRCAKDRRTCKQWAQPFLLLRCCSSKTIFRDEQVFCRMKFPAQSLTRHWIHNAALLPASGERSSRDGRARQRRCGGD